MDGGQGDASNALVAILAAGASVAARSTAEAMSIAGAAGAVSAGGAVVGVSGACGSTELAGVITSECVATSLGLSGLGGDDSGRGGTETERTELGGVDGC